MNKVQNGIHPSANSRIQSDFSREEQKIIRRWSEQWFISSAGKRDLGNSEFRYAYAKPTESMEEGTGITKELVIIFSPYSPFEARSLKAYEVITSEDIEQRYEKLCYVLISKDNEIESKISEFTTNQDDQIIVPFSYDSFSKEHANQFYIRNHFRKYFYSRDLFDYSEPLKRDTFFFGRSNIVTQIINKHNSGLNMGLFGLRKTGKTSIIYDVIRKSNGQGFIAVNIDCQNPSFHNRRWYEALYYVINEIYSTCQLSVSYEESQFTEKDASDLFRKGIEEVNKKTGKKLLIMFDEIENITFQKSPSEHWCNGLDFVLFWQCIRSVYQLYRELFTFCILGTNPKCVETPTIEGKDNPIFNMFQPIYIPGFDHGQTRDMIRKLGKIMGIKFDEGIYTRLVEDYGGHPFLMRRVCSKLSQINVDRPVQIDRQKYTIARDAFNKENTYFDMILNVLTQFYPDEYEMLTMLSLDDQQNFQYFVNEDPSMVNHLIGYGLIKRTDTGYDFKIDSVRDYIIRLNNNHIKPLSPSDKWAYLCTQRNNIEIRLRDMVRKIIRIKYKTEKESKEYVINKILDNDKRLLAHPYKDLFDPKKSNIYLKGLSVLIKANWEVFEDYFLKQDVFINHMSVLNNEGRFDAHAKIPDDDEISAVNNSVKYFENSLNRFDEAFS